MKFNSISIVYFVTRQIRLLLPVYSELPLWINCGFTIMILIESDTWRLWSEPEQGVQWMAAQLWHNDQWQDVVPDCRIQNEHRERETGYERPGQDARAPLSAASFHMIPYSNRIRDAQFTFDNRHIKLDNVGAHAIHGALRKLPWKLVSATSCELCCEFDTRHCKPINWPWPMHAQITHKINENLLTSTITITNTGDTPMPAGTGWHPYFVRRIGQSEPVLTLPVDAVFPDANGDCLPDGPAEELPAELDFTQGRPLDPDQRIDRCMAGLSGACHIHWEEAGIELIVSASEQCRYLILYNPDMPHFALEPVTNANDAFNLTAKGIEAGTIVLGAGECMSVSMQLEARLHV